MQICYLLQNLCVKTQTRGSPALHISLMLCFRYVQCTFSRCSVFVRTVVLYQRRRRNRQKRRHRSSLLFRGRNSFNSALQIYHQTQTFLQIFLAAKWLVRHSSTSTSPKQQRRPLPSLLSVSSSMPEPLKNKLNKFTEFFLFPCAYSQTCVYICG